MIIKWIDEINSFDKHKFIHEEKQLCYSRQNKNFSTNLLVGLLEIKLKNYSFIILRKRWLYQKVIIWLNLLRNQQISIDFLLIIIEVN